MPGLPQITKEEMQKIANAWTHKLGVAVILDDVSIRFATDAANLVLRNFVVMCAEQAQAAQVARKAQTIEGEVINTAPVPAAPATSKSSIILTD